MPKRIALLFLGVVLAACAKAGPAAGDSGVRGVAVAGPTCPVEIAGSPCPPQPIAIRIDVLDANGDTVTSIHSGSDGRFEVPLAPGTYTLQPVPPSPSGLPHGAPVEVTVHAGSYANVRIVLDTGIR